MSAAGGPMINVASRLKATAIAMPDALAVVEPLGYDRSGRRRYRHVTFAELDEDSDRIACGLRAWGVPRGARLALLVRPGIDFISLVFALFKAAAVVVLADPGMGLRPLLRCLADVEPEGLVGIPAAQAARALFARRLPRARWLVTVGRRWFWGGVGLEELRRHARCEDAIAPTAPDDPAAIIFTSGSTGPAKGVLYRHGNFDAQVDEIRDFYAIRPGEIDLSCFSLFGLFNCAMGVTAVLPDMDFSHPAQADPVKIVEAIRDWQVTQGFGSPALWARVGPYCLEHGIRLPSLRRVLAAGAPVPASVVEQMKACMAPEGELHTPYGATEALPVASISDREILGHTAVATRQGAGVCVGRKFPGIEWKVVGAVDGPLSPADLRPLQTAEIGELLVRGPVVTREYVTGAESNALAKVREGESVWHRMGDVGYLDSHDRFWFCGRLRHRVLKASGPRYTVCCEAIVNGHPAVARSALVGVGPPGRQRPVMVLQPNQRRLLRRGKAREQLLAETRKLAQASALTADIADFLLHPAFPVDVRHNAKISRERLAAWAARVCRPAGGSSSAWRELYPFASHWIELDGHRVHYLDEGSGPTLLLLHGNPTWSFFWRELVGGLRDRCRVIAPDLIGCGLSDKPSPACYSYELARRVDDVVRFIETLQLRQITLVAHDWGGAIGLGAAVACPERFRRLVLLNTAAFRARRMPWRIRLCRTPILGRVAVQGLNLFARAALLMAVAKPRRMTPPVRQGFLAPYDSWAHREAIYRFVLDIPMRPGHPSYSKLVQIETGLARLAHLPVSLIWGMRDWCFTPSFLERFLDFFPAAEVHRLADAGHYVVEDAHEQILPILRRLLENDACTPW